MKVNPVASLQFQGRFTECTKRQVQKLLSSPEPTTQIRWMNFMSTEKFSYSKVERLLTPEQPPTDLGKHPKAWDAIVPKLIRERDSYLTCKTIYFNPMQFQRDPYTPKCTPTAMALESFCRDSSVRKLGHTPLSSTTTSNGTSRALKCCAPHRTLSASVVRSFKKSFVLFVSRTR